MAKRKTRDLPYHFAVEDRETAHLAPARRTEKANATIQGLASHSEVKAALKNPKIFWHHNADGTADRLEPVHEREAKKYWEGQPAQTITGKPVTGIVNPGEAYVPHGYTKRGKDFAF